MSVRSPEQDARFVEFIRLFNEGRFFEAHEVLESLWLDARPEHRDALQGLVQVAVALEHHRRGNPRGAKKVLLRASGRLAKLEEGVVLGFGNMDLVGLVFAAKAYLEGRKQAPPRITFPNP
ncbi:MAG: DUF309 domain-containing protein [Acidobacteria bacterium]|nr:MAG: DUF309 domain-containing protein [Acidobacteriota bacterium]